MKKLTNNMMLCTSLLLSIIACEFMLALMLLPGAQFSDVYIFIFVNSALAVSVFFYSQIFKRNTEKNSTEETKKLKDDIALLNATLEATNDGLFVINSDGKITKYNNKFTEMFGIRDKYLKPNHTAKIYKHIKNQLLFSDQFYNQVRYLIKNPAEKISGRIELNNGNIFELYSYPIIIGKPIGRVLSFHDITSQVKSEEEINRHIEEIHETKDLMEQNAFELVKLNMKLEESEIELAALNANKDKFFSIIAHDLKSPFTALIGFTEMMIDDFDTFSKEELKEYIQTLLKSSKSTLNLLQNLLNWSRLQTGKMEFTPEKFDLFNIAHQVKELLENNAQTKGIKLINRINKNSYVVADKNMISTVIRNLISNAIKFTNHDGKVTISAQEKEDKLQVTISDTGIGMEEGDIKKLFRIDVHHTTRGTKNETGTGLGLILCSELVEKSGGKIWCSSKINKGTKFSFTLSKPKSPASIVSNNKLAMVS